MSHPVRATMPKELKVPDGHRWQKIPMIAGIVGLVGIAASVGLAMGELKQFYFSYVTAFMFWLSIALGGLFFVLIQHLVRAGWSVVVRRFAENAAGTLPVFVLLFIPIAIGYHDLYHHWVDAPADDVILQGKSGYLNVQFFFIRAAVYLLAWAFLGWYFLESSVGQDADGNHDTTRRLQARAAPALLVFALTLSFAAIDWVMSMDPHWYSTMWGVYYFAGSCLAIFAFLIVVVKRAQANGLLVETVNAEHFHDLGKFVFGFTVFWAYIAFSQFMLIWYANIPEETIWFMHRFEGSWYWIGVALVFGHFAFPFFFLMSRHVKRFRPAMMFGAVWQLVMHYVDLHWQIMPNLHHHGAHPSLVDLFTVIGVGGIFLAAFAWHVNKHSLIPIKDPRLPESLAFENF